MQNLGQDTSLTSLPEVTRTLSLSVSTQGKSDKNQDKVFPLLLNDVSEKAEELESFGKQYHKLIKSKKSNLRRFSISESDDYGDILSKKGLFLDNLTQAVGDLVENSLEVPNYTMHCYNQFSSLLETRWNESKQGILQKTELLKEQKHETTRLVIQGGIFARLDEILFANLVEEENEDLRKQEHRLASLMMFEEAKADLDRVIKISLPNEEERMQFLLVMSQLVEAHINNLDIVEDQYVEVPPSFFKNPGLVCLMDCWSNIVVEHPHNPTQLRLCVDD